ncbi:hypothetical protein DIPPA_22683 [Diplonema papillatum]|nr:hypothetical protein DIPPA_22683 [Diplonema papillatum]
MGLTQSSQKVRGGLIQFVEECHDRNEEDCVIETLVWAQYAKRLGPPTWLGVDADVFMKKEGALLKYRYEACVLTDELRRLICLLLLISGRTSLPRRHIIMVTSYLDYSRKMAVGPAPFFSNRVSMLFHTVCVFKMRFSGDNDKPVVEAKWQLLPDPALPRPRLGRDAHDVEIECQTGRVHPSHLLIPMRTWIDGWKRLRIELERLPLFFVDIPVRPSAALWLVNERQAFGFRQGQKFAKRPAIS